MPRATTLVNIAIAHCVAGRSDRAAPLMRAATSESPADWMHLQRVWEHIAVDDELKARSALDELRHAIPCLTADLVIRTVKRVRVDWSEPAVHFGLPA
jgi:hypothetical protein